MVFLRFFCYPQSQLARSIDFWIAASWVSWKSYIKIRRGGYTCISWFWTVHRSYKLFFPDFSLKISFGIGTKILSYTRYFLCGVPTCSSRKRWLIFSLLLSWLQSLLFKISDDFSFSGKQLEKGKFEGQ